MPPLPTLPRSLSLLLALILTLVSAAGILYSNAIYPTAEQLQTFMANDVVNLVIGLPVLLVSIWLADRGKLLGPLVWLGALLYVLYNYIAYLFGIPFSWITLAYLALVVLSAYLMFALLKNIDRKAVQRQLSGAVPVKLAGWILVVFGVFFLFRAISIISGAAVNQAPLPLSEIGVLIADLVVSTAWIAGGIALLRDMALGYVSAPGLLFAASMLFIGLIFFLLLQPVLTGAPFALIDVLVVFVMSLICFIPTALFIRGVISSS
jgi:hypothetical protein